MYCSPWDCQWKAPDRPFVFRWVDEPQREKSPLQQMHSNESRSEPKTPANMPSHRQLEFTFERVAIRTVERQDTVVGQALRLPIPQPATGAVALQLRGCDATLETEARQLLYSLGAKRIATELRVEWN